MSYECFLEEYKRRRNCWGSFCRVLFVLVMSSSVASYYLLHPFVIQFAKFDNKLANISSVGLSVLGVILASLALFEILVSGFERVLERNYLKPYVVIERDGYLLVYGFIRDADRTEFQLKLQKENPGYEYDLTVAMQQRCSFALRPKEFKGLE